MGELSGDQHLWLPVDDVRRIEITMGCHLGASS